MRIEEICNHPDRKRVPLEKVINLKDWGRPLFPIEYNLGVDWDRLELSLINFHGYFYETSLNNFHMISINGKSIILVCFDKVQQAYKVFCLNEDLYKTFIKIVFAYAKLHCIYDFKNTDYLLPDEEGYKEQFEDYD